MNKQQSYFEQAMTAQQAGDLIEAQRLLESAFFYPQNEKTKGFKDNYFDWMPAYAGMTDKKRDK